ncbi:MAG: hypothetical protein ABJQ34_19535 [Paracoccaceae bacterium]
MKTNLTIGCVLMVALSACGDLPTSSPAVQATETPPATANEPAPVPSELKFTTFSVYSKRPEVKILNVDNGFSLGQVMGFVREHCAGPVSQIQPTGETGTWIGRKYTRYTMNCQGGPNQSIVVTSSFAVEVEAMGSQNSFEYTFGDENGNLLYKQIKR